MDETVGREKMDYEKEENGGICKSGEEGRKKIWLMKGRRKLEAVSGDKGIGKRSDNIMKGRKGETWRLCEYRR